MQTYLFDRQTGQVRLVSHAATTPTSLADGGSYQSSISGDGSHVIFASKAGNLVAGFSRPWQTLNIFDYSVPSAVRLVSHAASSLVAGDDDSFAWVVSGDGGVVGFSSDATNLISGVSSAGDAFAYLTSTQTVSLVSENPSPEKLRGEP